MFLSIFQARENFNHCDLVLRCTVGFVHLDNIQSLHQIFSSFLVASYPMEHRLQRYLFYTTHDISGQLKVAEICDDYRCYDQEIFNGIHSTILIPR